MRRLRQDDLHLPEGPVLLNPETILVAIKKEIIDGASVFFKTSCLRKLQRLFATENPYFAGYGNRTNDVTAYEAVGIPRPRIFIINRTGELRGIVAETFQTSYRDQSSLVDVYFPSISILHTELDLGYWSTPHPPVEDLPV